MLCIILHMHVYFCNFPIRTALSTFYRLIYPMMKNIRTFLLSACFLGLSMGLFAQAVETSVPHLNAVEGDTVTVAISVNQFNAIASASLVLNYNATVLQYLGYQNVHPSLAAGMLIPGGIPPQFKLAWFSLTPATIGTGTLIELQFLAVGAGVSALTWDTITQGNCSYSDFAGNELPVVFTSGSVTVISLAKGFKGKVFLQGPFNLGSGLMTTGLANAGHLPLSQPYNTAPWNYNGTESLTSIPSGMVDWVIVELRRDTNVTQLVERRAALLMSDGRILDTDLSDEVAFDSSGMFYVAVDHRNHMPVMTGTALSIPDTNMFDLSSSSTTVYGGGTILLTTNLYGMIAGDVSKNGQLKYSGGGNDRSLILNKIVAVTGTTAINTTIQGYHKEDTNLDGTVRYSGGGNDAARIISNIVTLTGSNAINGTYNIPVPPAN